MPYLTKKICFKDGYQMLQLSRENFVTDEAFQRFLIYSRIKEHQISYGFKWKSRKILMYKQLMQYLKSKNETAAMDFLKV